MAIHAFACRVGPCDTWWRQAELFDRETGHTGFDNNEHICGCCSAPSCSAGVWATCAVQSEIKTCLCLLIGALRRHSVLRRSVQTGCRPLRVLFVHWLLELLQWEVSTMRCHLLGTSRMSEDTLLYISVFAHAQFLPNCFLTFILSFGATAPSGPGPPHSQGF
jgi:hypothetical protein